MLNPIAVVMVARLISGSHQQLHNMTNLEKPLTSPCNSTTSIYCWTDWFNEDEPGGNGDWETLLSLQMQYPGKICPKPVDIEAETVSGLSVAIARDVIYKYEPTIGFICRNLDQKRRPCRDYKVRFSCPLPFCGGICWTKWFNTDDPSGSGDWEPLNKAKIENPGQILSDPEYIYVVTEENETPAMNTGQIFHTINPTQGFICHNKDQTVGTCLDYKVRYGFPCKNYSPFNRNP